MKDTIKDDMRIAKKNDDVAKTAYQKMPQYILSKCSNQMNFSFRNTQKCKRTINRPCKLLFQCIIDTITVNIATL